MTMMKLAIKSISVGVLMAASMSASAFTFPDILASQGRVEYRPNNRTVQSNQPVPAISSNIITIADRAVIRDISREDLEEMKLISRRVLQKLPTEQQIANLEIRNPADRQLQLYIRQGAMAIKKMASDAEQLSPE
jgi:acyl CoA:acetate/3-ketoacid CoA transferase